MGSIPNSLSLDHNLPPNNHGDNQTLTLPHNKLATSISQATSSVRYMECLRNHGAAIGAHILDGCGEFMPNGDKGSPGSFKCAACGCHRSFHRRLSMERNSLDITSSVYLTSFQNYSCNPGKSIGMSQRPIVVPTSIVHGHLNHKGFLTAPAMVAFSGGAVPQATASSSEDDLIDGDDRVNIQSNGLGQTHYHNSKNKRSRTKFTKEQKDKMASFAEKLGWRIGKGDEEEVARFCAEARVKRQVFKVWMHNSKQAMKKKLLRM